jgi:rhamnosyltransferase
MNTLKLPKIAVLLAAYNGKSWIQDQINSILKQNNVQVDIFVSIDFSSDGTYDFLMDLQKTHTNISVLDYGQRFGGAAKNFYRLIKDVDISKYDYVSFSDQDDLWFSDKLYRGVSAIELKGLDAYSCDVKAFWQNGKTKIIKKSYPQKKYDFIFQSAGSGATYIFRTNVLSKFKKFILANWIDVNKIDLHDWLIYAYCRSNNFKWLIDPYVGMLYRQHINNEFGANTSLSSYIKRWSMLRNGWYFGQVFKISKLLDLTPPNRSFILSNFMQIRRKKIDILFLVFHTIFFGKKLS